MKVFSKLLKRLKINNSGSAIVVVIMAMGFVAVLGVTVMWMSLSNFRMKATDMKNKQSFYTAEAIYDQIKVGLQYDASVAAGQAYTATLQSYSYDSWNEDERAAYFKKQYISNLILCLKNPSNDQEYDLNHLLSYVDADVHLSVNPAAKGNPIRFLYYSGTPTLLDSGKDYLLLKNLKLEYTDDDGFYSVIDTDIMISAPEVPFNSASKSIDLLFYALIANMGIEVGNPAALTVDGSIYAGDNGINLCKPITVNGALNVISKGPINIENNNAVFKITDLSSPLANTLDGRKLDTKGGLLTKLFAKDINVTDGTFSVAADSYIADDLTISGQNSEVEFDHGTYTGYGYSLNEGTSTLSSNNSSSAIIVNGLQSNIDMSTLTQLTLGGSAFVGTSRAGSYDIDHTGEFATTMANNAPVSNNDIPTGESISIKGDQLAYLVPGECIGVKDGKSIYSKNPLTLQEYEQMIGEISYRDTNNNLIIKDRCSLIDINVDVRSYGAGKRLSAYISDDYTKNTKWIFAPSNGQTLVYLYLQFNSRDQANKFFSDYYNVNTDRWARHRA